MTSSNSGDPDQLEPALPTTGIDEQTRTNTVTAFTSILRAGSLGGINIQRAGLAMHTLIEHTPADTALDLQSIAHFLTQNQAPQSAVIEAMVVLHSRAPRLGVSMELPLQCSALTAEDRTSIVDAYTARMEKAERRAPPPVAPTPRPEFERKRQATDKTSRYLGVALVACIVGFVASTSYVGAQLGPPPVVLKYPKDAAGLPCAPTSPPMSRGTGRCTIPKAYYEQQGVPAVETRADITKAALASQGVNRLMVLTDDGKVRAVR